MLPRAELSNQGPLLAVVYALAVLYERPVYFCFFGVGQTPTGVDSVLYPPKVGGGLVSTPTIAKLSSIPALGISGLVFAWSDSSNLIHQTCCCPMFWNPRSSIRTSWSLFLHQPNPLSVEYLALSSYDLIPLLLHQPNLLSVESLALSSSYDLTSKPHTPNPVVVLCFGIPGLVFARAGP